MKPRRGPGRPTIEDGEKSGRLHFRIPIALHDRACVRAIRSRRSVSAVIRDALRRYLDDEDAGVLSQENR